MYAFDRFEKKIIYFFEKLVCRYVGCKYAIFMSSGSAALHSALSVLEFEKGDEVIVPINCFPSTLSAIILVGAKPVFVDIEKTTFNIDEYLIEDKINIKTKAILIVDSFGNPNNCSYIKKIAKKHNLIVIEDAAQAFGSKYNGKRVGGYFDLTCFSFNKKKILSAMTGGGLVATNNKNYSHKIREFINYGIGKNNSSFGWNYLPNFLSATILIFKLFFLSFLLGWRQLQRNNFLSVLVFENISLQQECLNGKSNWNQIVFISNNIKRIAHKLKENGYQFEKVSFFNEWYLKQNNDKVSNYKAFYSINNLTYRLKS